MDVKKELTENTGQLKSELAAFREVSLKLNTIATDLKDITNRVEQAKQRLADVEEWSTDAKELLIHFLELYNHLQVKLTELEAHSCRNNIRIHSIPKVAEGKNIQVFITNFLKTELHLPDASLGIQRCHWFLGVKHPQGSSPRSILIYFLEYKTQELIHIVPGKKRETFYDGKRVFFEQDYPTEIITKRKVECPPTKDAPMMRPRQPLWEAAGAVSRRHRDKRLIDIRERLKGFWHTSNIQQHSHDINK